MKSMAHKRQERSRRFDAKSRFRRWKEEGHWKTLLWSVLAGESLAGILAVLAYDSLFWMLPLQILLLPVQPGDVCEVAAETAHAASPGISGASAVADDPPCRLAIPWKMPAVSP